MSRIGKVPIVIPIDVEVALDDQVISVKGKNGEITYTVHPAVKIIKVIEKNILIFKLHQDEDNWAQAGTARSLVNAMIVGVTEGFIKKLVLVGIGYRVSVKNNFVELSLGFSNIIKHPLPKGITAECPSQTEIILKGINKQVIGQVSADLRAYRSPEPYKGKGIRYADEIIRIKEAKKK